MQPCFTPAKQVKASVNLLSILTAGLSFEYMDRKRRCTPSFLSLSNSFCRGIKSKAFLKSTKHEKSKFWRVCGLDSNNLYGWAMFQPLPYRDFKWIDPEEIILDNYHENSNKGIILEVAGAHPYRFPPFYGNRSEYSE